MQSLFFSSSDASDYSVYYKEIGGKYAKIDQELVRKSGNNLTNARREMINTTGTKPENDIHKTNIATVQSELNRIETEFIKRYSNTKLR